MKKLNIVFVAILSNVSFAVECETDVDVSLIATNIKQSDNINNTYIGELIRINIDTRFNEDFGVAANIVSDKRLINDRLTELNNIYGYYIFDQAGELHFGHDKPIDRYIRVIEDNDITENRNISGYFKLCSNNLFEKYSIVDDHSCLKFTWMTPTYNGYKLGLSYSPNTSLCRGTSDRYAKDLISIGGMCNGILFNKLPYGFSVIGYVGKSQDKTLHNIKSAMCEFYVRYKTISINNRVVIDNSSLQSLKSNNLDASYYSSIQFDTKKLQLSIGYFTSRRTILMKRFCSKAYIANILYKTDKFNTFLNFKQIHTDKITGHSISIGINKKFSVVY